MFSNLRRFILFVLYGIRPNKSDIVPELSDHSQMNEALLVTALGIIAGLSAHSLIMAVSSLNEGNYVKSLWGIVLAFLLGVASLARMKSHYVYGKVRYDNTFALIDVAYIVANSFTIGLLDSHHFPKREFWIAVAFNLFMLLCRLWRLQWKYSYNNFLAQTFLTATLGCVFVIVIWFPDNSFIASIFGIISMISLGIQFYIYARHK